MRRHLVLYDGVCGLCDRLVAFLLAHDRAAVFRFAPLQGAAGRAWVARLGGDPDALTTLYVVEDFEGPHPRLHARSRGALFVLRTLGGPWRLAGILRALPWALLDRVYDGVARRRYRWFGEHDACPAPPAEHRARFLD